jgi:acyl carrier protein
MVFKEKGRLNMREQVAVVDVLRKVQLAFRAAFDVDPESIGLATVPSDVPRWDSLGHVTLVNELASAFSLSFDVDDAMEMENVRQIVAVVQSKLEQASDKVP